MKGDVLVIEKHHRSSAKKIVSSIVDDIQKKTTRFTITVAGESGSGKSEMGQAIKEALADYQINAVVLGQDDYFMLPPKTNDERRRKDPEWLGPHVEVKLDILEKNLADAVLGKPSIQKPLIDYQKNTVEEETIDLEGVRVVIAEGTYTSLLKSVDIRIFINRNRLDTLEHRRKRNRGEEVGDPFIEKILKIEHKIIAGHKHLADFIISKDYEVSAVGKQDVG